MILFPVFRRNVSLSIKFESVLSFILTYKLNIIEHRAFLLVFVRFLEVAHGGFYFLALTVLTLKDEALSALFKAPVRTALRTLFISVIKSNQFIM